MTSRRSIAYCLLNLFRNPHASIVRGVLVGARAGVRQLELSTWPAGTAMQQVSPNVFLQGKAVYLHNESFVDNVKGDEPGKGGGVVSQVNVKISHDIDHSKSVYVNGQEIVRTGDKMWMNWRKT